MNAKDTVKRIAGKLVRDNGAEAGTAAWVQKECRSGGLAKVVARFAESQPEELDPKQVVVDSLSASGVDCRIPAMISDRESLHPFRIDVEFSIALPSLKVVRKSG